MFGWLTGKYNKKSKPAKSDPMAPLVGEIDENFQPTEGSFFQTLEFPEFDSEGKLTGRIWLEAGYDPAAKTWVLWQKSIREMEDPLLGGMVHIMSSKALFEKTSFSKVFDQMTTFETAQKSLGVEPMETKTPAKLGGDYFRQFAWREKLIMSRSGRLYPISTDKITSDNYFNQQDLVDAKAFLERLKTTQFIAVPLVLPAVDWEKAYAARQKETDQRLNALYHRFDNNRENYDLALQIVAHEAPEVLYAFLKQGFSPNIFKDNATQHFNLLKAAILRPNVEVLNLLSEAGISFFVQHENETPLELVLRERRYSHLHVMLSRDSATLANYTDAEKNHPAVLAMELQDPQAFRMLYQQGLDFSLTDTAGWSLVHHAFAQNFIHGIYAWVDEGLPIDYPIANTEFTGLSIAKLKGHQPLIDFAVKHGANPDAPVMVMSASSVVAGHEKTIDVPIFSVDILNSTATNAEITAAATAYVAGGGSLDLINAKGVSLLELCWKNKKQNSDLDRRALISVFGGLGADPSAQLEDGSTVLTRAAKGSSFDAEFVAAIAPYARDVSRGDDSGNNILHMLQLNSNELMGHSKNIALVLKLFPQLDVNHRNNDGYSNMMLAVRLNRSNTLKVFAADLNVDWMQTTAGGYTCLDLAFTNACGMEKVAGAPRADSIKKTSETTRSVMLDIIERTAKQGSAGQKKELSMALNRLRPDSKTLLNVLTEENAADALVKRLVASGLQLPPRRVSLGLRM